MESKRKILVVDDNETNLYTLKKVLERMQVEIHSAMSGPQAISLAKNHLYSLALIDIQMPEMDGFETLKRVRLTAGNENLPVVLISAIYTEDQYRIKGMETGAVDFIPKPVSPEIIRAKVKVFLDLEEQRIQLKSLVDQLQEKNKELTNEIKKRKKTEEELKKARAIAERNSEQKSQLLVNMSHEIRTPVNSILGFADLIINPDIPPGDKEKYLHYVTNSSQNLLFLIDEILEHSRLEAGEMKISEGACNIDELLTELHEVFQKIKDQSGKKDIQIILDTADRSENHLISTDYQRLRQVLSNLLQNAIKYSKNGEIHIGYKLDQDTVEFYVKDSGIGISEEDLIGIFDRFKRVENLNDIRASGTGLGLSLCKRIVDLLGGKIWVTSKINVGSEFRFTIPLRIIEDSTIVKTQVIKDEGISIWSNHTLLIAEDEEMNFLFLKEALKSTGIKITWAKNGNEAVRYIEDNPAIDLVLMDIKMPDMDGYTATKKIKSINSSLPVIIQTAFALSDEKEKSFEKGCDDFITKPINRKLLIKTLRRFLTS